MTTTDVTPDVHPSACILCECNCGIQITLADRRFAKIRGDERHPGSSGYTCKKALLLDRYQNGRHRLTTPLRRRPDGTHEEVSWDTAIGEIAQRLQAIKDEHGGEKIFFYGGGGQGNHLGGIHGRALQAALGAHYTSNPLAQEKTGEMWVDGKLYGGHTRGDVEHAEVVLFLWSTWPSSTSTPAGPTRSLPHYVASTWPRARSSAASTRICCAPQPAASPPPAARARSRTSGCSNPHTAPWSPISTSCCGS